MPWTPEQAREMGRRGGKASARSRVAKASRSPRERAEAFFGEYADALATELLRAAGVVPPKDADNDPYKDLKGSERASLVVRALEFGIGRPMPGRAAKNVQPGRDALPVGLNIQPDEA